MRQRPDEVFDETCGRLAGEGARCLQLAGEFVRAGGQRESFQCLVATCLVWNDQGKAAQVGHQNQVVAAPVARHLLANRRAIGVFTGRLHLHDAPFRHLSLPRAAALHLMRGVEAEVGMASALVGQFADAEHLRLQGRADGVEQVRQRPIARPLAGCAAGGVDAREVGEVSLDCGGQFRACRFHPSPCGRVALLYRPGFPARDLMPTNAARAGFVDGFNDCNLLSNRPTRPSTR